MRRLHAKNNDAELKVAIRRYLGDVQRLVRDRKGAAGPPKGWTKIVRARITDLLQ
jgi:hypothetical protein